MKKTTLQSLIKTVRQRWINQYPPHGKGPDGWKTINDLSDLDMDYATIDDVRSIVGNDSWTQISCYECGNYVEEAVEISELDICKSCINKMLDLINE